MHMNDELASFSVLDYSVFAAVLVINLGIGVMFAFRGHKNIEDFLLGGRKMSVTPVSLSLLSSFVTGITLLGYSGESYAHGMQLSMMIWGALVAIFISARIFLPVFYHLKLTSINEYIELRFNSQALRLTLTAIGTVSGLFYTALWLFAPAMALSSVTPMSTDTYIVLLGIVCTIYSALGGLKAVVWTDTFQMIVIFIGVVAVIIVGCLEVGGISNVWTIASQHDRTQLFDLSFNFCERHNLLNVLILGTAFYFCIYGANQTTLQRSCSVSSIEEAKRVYYINMIGMMVCVTMVFFSGLCIFACYAGCDPITKGHILSKDQILPYFVVDKMSFLNGMPGLFVAAIVSGATSSLSSLINSTVAILWSDLLLKFSYFQNLSPSGATVVNKLLSFLIGGVMIVLALLLKGFAGLFQIAMTVMGIMGGPTMGVFAIGLLIPHVGKKGACFGFILSTGVMTWLSIGASISKPKPSMLPLSVENCTSSFNNQSLGVPFREDIYVNITAILSPNTNDLRDEFTKVRNAALIDKSRNTQKPAQEGIEKLLSTTTEHTELAEDKSTITDQNSPMMYFYSLSYTLYTALGSLLCIVAAVIFTVFIGAEDLNQVRPDLLAPISRRFLPTTIEGRNGINGFHATEDLNVRFPYKMQRSGCNNNGKMKVPSSETTGVAVELECKPDLTSSSV